MTNKIALRSVEEFMADYTPVYQPLYPLLLGKSQQYEETVGELKWRRVEAKGDIRAKIITPKDTEIQQISVGEGKKAFKKYFLANQYTQSELQDEEGIEEVIAQVLDEHQKQADELMMYGGSEDAGATVINNALIYSTDSNYVLKSSAAIADLGALHTKIVEAMTEANQISGRKAIIYYGATMIAKSNTLYSSSPVPFKTVLAQVLPPNSAQLEVPAAVLAAGLLGFVIVNLDQVKLHYTTLPQLKNQGVNEEKMYSWHNFLMGSMMVEVLAKGGIIRQPLTFSF